MAVAQDEAFLHGNDPVMIEDVACIHANNAAYIYVYMHWKWRPRPRSVLTNQERCSPSPLAAAMAMFLVFTVRD